MESTFTHWAIWRPSNFIFLLKKSLGKQETSWAQRKADSAHAFLFTIFIPGWKLALGIPRGPAVLHPTGLKYYTVYAAPRGVSQLSMLPRGLREVMHTVFLYRSGQIMYLEKGEKNGMEGVIRDLITHIHQWGLQRVCTLGFNVNSEYTCAFYFYICPSAPHTDYTSGQSADMFSLSFFSAVLVTEPRPLHLLGKHSTTELCCQPPDMITELFYSIKY